MHAPAVNDDRGFALIVVLMLMALLLSLGAVGARTAQIELLIAGNDVSSRKALESAEAGIDHALALLRASNAGVNGATNGFDDELASGGTGGALAAIGPQQVLDDGLTYRCNQLSGQHNDDGYCLRVSDNRDEVAGFDDPAADLDDSVTLRSRGVAGAGERVVEVRIRREPVYPCVLCTDQDFPGIPAEVALLAGFASDSFDSRVAPYDPATAGSYGNIVASGGIAMSGSPAQPVVVDGSLTATGAIQTVSPPVNVSGPVAPFQTAQRHTPVAPCGPPYPASQPITGGSYDPATGVLTNTAPNQVIQLDGTSSGAPQLFCFSAITMNANSRLQANGAVHIRLTQPSVILGLTNTTGRAADLRISSSVNQPPPALPAIAGLSIGAVAGSLTMVIEAPNASVAFLGPVADFFGQIIAGMPPPGGLATRLHYDRALDAPRILRVGWREIRSHPPS